MASCYHTQYWSNSCADRAEQYTQVTIFAVWNTTHGANKHQLFVNQQEANASVQFFLCCIQRFLYFECFCGTRRNWLFSTAVIKINREHLYTILTKNARISTSSSLLMTNMCLICNAIVAFSKKCKTERHCMTMHKDYISK